MIIACPECQKKLRINAINYAGKKLSLTCRKCGRNFLCQIPVLTKILIAHGDPDVCQTVLEVCQQDIEEILTCSDASTARQLLDRHACAALLLDVALPGAFPFQLIDEIQRSGEPTVTVLLSSVYNRTAYKCKPSSLYGAQGYLELHHLSDRLIPLLQELVPDLALKSQPCRSPKGEEDEQPGPDSYDTGQKAAEIARLLIADIALYHQEQLDLGILRDDLEKRMDSQLKEGRRILAGRIPQAELETQDYLLSALMVFAKAREKELRIQGVHAHG